MELLRSKIVKCILVLMCVAISWCVFLNKRVLSLKDDNARLKSNQAALVDSVRHYKTSSGKNVASIQTLQVDDSELKEQLNDMSAVVKDLGIKLKRVQQISTSASETKIKATADLKDSIIYVDSSAHKIQAIRYADPWVNVDGILYDKKVSLDISSRDTLYTVLHRVPKKFLFFKYGTKFVKQEIVSSNPHTRITFARTANLVK